MGRGSLIEYTLPKAHKLGLYLFSQSLPYPTTRLTFACLISSLNSLYVDCPKLRDNLIACLSVKCIN